MALVHECLGLHHDACNTLDARRCAHGDEREEASRRYHPHHGGRYDSGEDKSPSPDLPGPQAFGRHILKYSRETNPGLWLEDYRLAYQASGVDNDDFIIRNLPLFLADSAQTWLEHLPSNRI